MTLCVPSCTAWGAAVKVYDGLVTRTLIDPADGRFGPLWQSDAASVAPLPGVFEVCCAAFCPHAYAQPPDWLMTLSLRDEPDGCLPDAMLFAVTRTLAGWLQAPAGVAVHCQAGVSRSSYLVLALLMARWGSSYPEALAWLRARRPEASPNSGFSAQLERLAPVLRRCLAPWPPVPGHHRPVPVPPC